MSQKQLAFEQFSIEVDEAIDQMTSLIQPLMTVVLGGILLFILLGLYMPMFEMHKLFSH